jgi:hypothetical protein
VVEYQALAPAMVKGKSKAVEIWRPTAVRGGLGGPTPPSASLGEDSLLKVPASHGAAKSTISELPAWREPQGSEADVGREGDRVECSVFAPTEATAGSTILVQAFAHLSDQAHAAMGRAKESDPGAGRRAIKTLESKVLPGTVLTFSLSLPGMAIDDPVQSVVWEGEPDSAQFGVTIPKSHPPGSAVGTLTVAEGWLPIGHIKFTLTITSRAAEPPPMAVLGDDATRYTVAFVSYASSDRTKVLDRVQVLPLFGIRFFQDVLDLEPGERWERSLYRHIDESDIVLLFWSKAAKRSKWVRREIRYALDRKQGDEFAPPAIGPVLIEGPPVPHPWKELAHLHFNDKLLYFMQR